MNEGNGDAEFFALLAEHRDEVIAALGPDRWALLEEVQAEGDPAELRAELEDLLLEVLSAEHPLIRLMRSRIRFTAAPSGDEVRTAVRDLLRGTEALTVIGRAGQEDREPQVRAVDPPSPDAGPLEPDAEPPWVWLSRQTRRRLLGLPSLAPDEVRSVPDAGPLVVLRGPDGPRVPAFQLDPDGRPWPELLMVNTVLEADRDPWGVACWWVDPHAELDRPPAELLGTDRATWLVPLACRMEED